MVIDETVIKYALLYIAGVVSGASLVLLAIFWALIDDGEKNGHSNNKKD